MNLSGAAHMNENPYLAEAVLFFVGLCIALAAAALLFFDIIESGVAAMIGIVGIGLIAVSGSMFAASGGSKIKRW